MTVYLITWLITKLLTVFIFLAFLTPAEAQTPPVSPILPPSEAFMPKELDKDEVRELARITAKEHGLDVDKFVWTAQCESSYRWDAVGDNGTSYGAWQIHLPSHPEITQEQALDVYWATEWAAKEFKEGRDRKWTCARKYGK